MTHSALVLGIAAAWAVVAIIPGPSFAVVSRLALSHSRGASLVSALGVALCALTYAAAGMFGAGLIVANSPRLSFALRIAGAAYLAVLGLATWRAAGLRSGDDALGRASTWGALPRGFAASAANPKAIVFFLGLFSAAVPPGAPLRLKLTVLAVGGAIELGWYSLVALLLSAPAARAHYDRDRRTHLRRASGGNRRVARSLAGRPMAVTTLGQRAPKTAITSLRNAAWLAGRL